MRKYYDTMRDFKLIKTIVLNNNNNKKMDFLREKIAFTFFRNVSESFTSFSEEKSYY